MPDLKHNFSRGRMNKDLDERLVPDGEYRDAENIEIVTSEKNSFISSILYSLIFFLVVLAEFIIYKKVWACKIFSLLE